MNMNGEFPLEEVISIRLHASEKKRSKDLPMTYREIFLYGLNALSDEKARLKFEISNLEESVFRDESELNANKSLLAAKKNRLRMIAPKELDEDTLASMLLDSAREYALSIFNSHGDDSILRIESSLAKKSIMAEGRDLGYDGDAFFVEVKNQLEEMCNTGVYDISDSDLEDM